MKKLLSFAFLAACSSGGSGTGGDLAGGHDLAMSGSTDLAGDLAMTADMTGSGMLPDPGTGMVGSDWLDTEPNDTPGQAVKMGTSTGAGVYTWMGFVASPVSQIGGNDSSDWYVFKSGPTAGENFYSQVCGTGASQTIESRLYAAPDLTQVAASPGPASSCATIMYSLQANTIYGLEVRAVSGSGTYSA